MRLASSSPPSWRRLGCHLASKSLRGCQLPRSTWTLRSCRAAPLRPIRRGMAKNNGSVEGHNAELVGPARPTSSITREADQFFRSKPQLGTFVPWKTVAVGFGAVGLSVAAVYAFSFRRSAPPTAESTADTLVFEVVEEEDEDASTATECVLTGSDGRKLRRTLVARMPKSVEDLQHVPHVVINVLLTTVVVTLTTVVAWSRMQWQWSRRHFMGHVNFSLNTYNKHNNKLSFRTLFERPLEDLMYKNKAAVKVVSNASRKTLPGQPMLMIDPEENWFVTNAVLNAISEHAFSGHMWADTHAALGPPGGVRPNWYVFGITCEKDEGVWNKKIRVMLMRQDVLESIPEVPGPEFEAPHHGIRWRTIQTMAHMWRRQCQGHPGVLSRVDIPVATSQHHHHHHHHEEERTST